MNKFSGILSILSFLGVCILGVLHFTGGKAKVAKSPKIVSTGEGGKTAVVAGSRCAYVDIDTLESQYKYFKQKKAEFEKKDKEIAADIERQAREFQAEVMAYQKKMQEGKITSEAEAKATEERLSKKQQDIESRKQSSGSKFLKEQDDFNNELQDKVRAFLAVYAEENGFDYVFMHSQTSLEIMYVNPEDDITAEVVEALNSGKDYRKKKDSKNDAKDGEAKVSDTTVPSKK
jgi:outer membrane protein